MAWSNSKIFQQTVDDVFDNTAPIDCNGDTFKAALYDNDITPDNTVTAANSAYNAGQWASAGNEVSDGTNWDAGGEPLTSVTSAPSAGVWTFDAADTPQGGASTTLANVYGCLVYSDTVTTPVADQGLCYNYFGGVQSVTGGTFTIVWNASGICAINVA
jgi:hypothetical protein